MSYPKSTLVSLLLATCSLSRTFAYPAPSPQAPSCIPSTTFSLQAVSPDPTINDVYITIGTGNAAFLNHTNEDATTFFKNDTNHLFAYVLEELGPTGQDGTEVELRKVFAYNDGPVFTLETDQNVFYGDYVARDVAFPKPEGKLGFEPEGNDGTALGGWWACPYNTITGSYYAVFNGAPGFDGSYNFGYGEEACTEFEVQIKPIENVEC